MSGKKQETNNNEVAEETFKFGDREFENSEAGMKEFFSYAESLKKENENLSKVLGKQGQELGQLRKLTKQSPSHKPVNIDESKVSRLAELFEEDPAAAIQNIVQETAAQTILNYEAQKAEESKILNQANSLWDKFFTKYPELAANESRKKAVKESARTFLADALDADPENEEVIIRNYWYETLGIEQDSNVSYEPPSSTSISRVTPKEKEKSHSAEAVSFSKTWKDFFEES